MDATTAEFGPYVVRHYPSDPERLVIVFTGAGQDMAREPIEEFRNSLSGLGVSLCFVADRVPSWFSHEDTPAMLDHVTRLAAAYRHVGAMGESMGASGAIMFADRCDHLERVLAFAPQFSMADPFIRFDVRFYLKHELFRRQVYSTFDSPERSDRAVLLFGADDWADLVHAGMYGVYGYEIGFVEGADHLVPRWLKHSDRGNLLIQLLARFADFTLPFGYEAVQAVLGDLVSRKVHSRSFGVGELARWNARSDLAAASPRRLPAPEGLKDLAAGCRTDQSSVSKWSRGTSEQDSARAITHEPTGQFAFHTGADDPAWWSIDFGRPVVVRLMRIYNRMGEIKIGYRNVQFAIEVSDDGLDWREVFRKANRGLFGGADGEPFVWAPEAGLATSRLRIRLLGPGAMHYDRIEIFG